MKIALAQAKKAAAEDEVPVGAVVVKDGKIIAKAHNLKEKKGMATRHAEIEAIERAAKKRGTGGWKTAIFSLRWSLARCVRAL